MLKTEDIKRKIEKQCQECMRTQSEVHLMLMCYDGEAGGKHGLGEKTNISKIRN